MSFFYELLEMNLGFPDRSQLEGSENPPLMPSESRDLGCPESPEQNKSHGSLSKSSSDDSDELKTLDKFLEAFPNPPQLIQSGSYLWIFHAQSENNSSSVDVGAPMNTIHRKIISAFSNISFGWWDTCLAQFWAPVRIDGRLLLSNSGQPFSVTDLHKDLAEYRVDSEKYNYNIDVNNNELHIEGDPMITSGGPAAAFLNRWPCTIIDDDRRKLSLMLPVCFPSQSSCVGVLQFTLFHRRISFCGYVFYVIKRIKDAGLDIYNVQEQIPYKTINGLKPAKNEIEHALHIVCRSHNLSLAQVWIGVNDKSHVPLSSYLEDTQRVYGLKLTGYLHDEFYDLKHGIFRTYTTFCDVMPRGSTEKHALKTLQDFKSRYFSLHKDDVLLYWEEQTVMASSLVICLRSTHTGDFNFAFEFTWLDISRCDISLEAILLTLKSCLPSFKFAHGAELDDELDVIEVDCSKYNQTPNHGILPLYNEICNIKIFQGKPSSPIPKALEEGKQPMVVDYIAPFEKTTPEVLPLEDTEKQLDVISVKSPTRGETRNIKVVQGKRLSQICKSVEEGKKPLVKCKTAEILLTLQDVEKHFDKTMKEAAKCLEVSESTLKRKLRKFGIGEWPRTKPLKRNKKDLLITQIDTNEEVNGAIQEPSTITIKAEYAGRMIRSSLLISLATFETVVKEIGVKFKLNLGTYDLTYLDEDGDWILLTSDEDMSDCIKSSRKSDRILVRLRVLPST